MTPIAPRHSTLSHKISLTSKPETIRITMKVVSLLLLTSLLVSFPAAKGRLHGGVHNEAADEQRELQGPPMIVTNEEGTMQLTFSTSETIGSTGAEAIEEIVAVEEMTDGSTVEEVMDFPVRVPPVTPTKGSPMTYTISVVGADDDETKSSQTVDAPLNEGTDEETNTGNATEKNSELADQIAEAQRSLPDPPACNSAYASVFPESQYTPCRNGSSTECAGAGECCVRNYCACMTEEQWNATTTTLYHCLP